MDVPHASSEPGVSPGVEAVTSRVKLQARGSPEVAHFAGLYLLSRRALTGIGDKVFGNAPVAEPRLRRHELAADTRSPPPGTVYIMRHVVYTSAT